MSYGKKIFLAVAITGSLLLSSGVLAEDVSSTADSSGSTTMESSITINLATSSLVTEQDTAAEALAAQEAAQAVNMDENTAAASQQPKLLSDSPFYFLKNWSREIQSFFNFDPAKKAELQLKFSSEKLAEAKALLSKQKNGKALEEVQSSNEDFEKAKQLAIKQGGSQRSDQIMEKMAEKTIENQKTLDLLANDLSLDDQATIENAKEELVKKYLSAENPEKLQERLKNALSSQQGSEFKDVKNLQILQSIKDAAPEEMKQKIEELNGELINKLNEKLASLPPEKAQILESYLGSIKGGDIQSLSVALLLKDQNISTTTLEKIKNAEEKITEKLNQRLEQGQEQNSQALIDKIIGYLGNGEMKNLKILTDLTDNASSTVLSQLLGAQDKARENLLNKLESLPEDQRQQMMDQFASSSDLKILKALTENSDSLPQDKKQQIEQIAEKIQNLIKTKFSGATSTDELQKIIDKVSSGDVKDMKDLKNLVKDSPLIKEIINGALNSVISRLKNIKDPADIEELQKEILGSGSIGSASSSLFQELDSIKQKLRSKMTPRSDSVGDRRS